MHSDNVHSLIEHPKNITGLGKVVNSGHKVEAFMSTDCLIYFIILRHCKIKWFISNPPLLPVT